LYILKMMIWLFGTGAARLQDNEFYSRRCLPVRHILSVTCIGWCCLPVPTSGEYNSSGRFSRLLWWSPDSQQNCWSAVPWYVNCSPIHCGLILAYNMYCASFRSLRLCRLLSVNVVNVQNSGVGCCRSTYRLEIHFCNISIFREHWQSWPVSTRPLKLRLITSYKYA